MSLIQSNDPSERGCTISGTRIEALIQSLDSISEGDVGMALLIGCGQEVVPYLAKFLLDGNPSSLSHARKRAVTALVELGARQVLETYLVHPPVVSDAAIRMGEEEVESLVARELARWPDLETENVLLLSAQRHLTLGAVYALGKLHLTAAIPLLVQALGDDTCYREITEVIAGMPVRIQPYLIRAVVEKSSNPTDVLRRRRAARLLLTMDLDRKQWRQIETLAFSEDQDLAITIARIGLRNVHTEQSSSLVRCILQKLRGLPWFLEAEVLEELHRFHSVALPLVAVRLQELQEQHRPTDPLDSEWRILSGFITSTRSS